MQKNIETAPKIYWPGEIEISKEKITENPLDRPKKNKIEKGKKKEIDKCTNPFKASAE
jgi:hypothetical protein